MWKLGSSRKPKRPQKVSAGGTVSWGDLDWRYIKCESNSRYLLNLFFSMKWDWNYFLELEGFMKKGNGFYINCRADDLPFGIILSIRKLKNVGQTSFTIPPSLPSACFGLKRDAQIQLFLCISSGPNLWSRTKCLLQNSRTIKLKQ